MAKASGGTRGRASGSTSDQPTSSQLYDVNEIKNTLVQYTKEDRYNRNTEYSMGFNAEAQGLVDRVAEGNYGIASDIAKSVQARGYNITEKQAYNVAKAAIDNNLLHPKKIGESIFWTKEKRAKFDAEQKAKELAKKKAREAKNANFVKSSTKIEVGSKVQGKEGAGEIIGIITKSTGYVNVRYANGKVKKEMAFNLKGEDGNYLKKKQ